MFDCWIGHTNFGLTKSVQKQIEEIPGIEAFKVMSRYRFFIGIGKLFKFRDVCQQIQVALGTTYEEEDGYDQSYLLEIVKTQLKSYERWAIFYSKEGLLEYAASNEEEDAEFDATVSRFTEDENFTVIKSEDEE